MVIFPKSIGRLRLLSVWRESARFVCASVAAVLFCFASAGEAQAQRGKIEPEGSSLRVVKKLVRANRQMVVAAHPDAVRAGAEILRAGGSAVDAVIATQLVLNLVEPQSSGIGGGAFLVRFDGGDHNVTSFDGRERAPMSARADRFMRERQPIPFREAVNSGLSVGVPGVVVMMADAHKRHGVLAWRDLFAPAIALAENGFVVSKRLNMLLTRAGSKRFSKRARAYFFSLDGKARPAGHVLRNREFAATLRLISKRGRTAFYEGAISQQIVEAVSDAMTGAGDLSLEDLRDYRSVTRAPVCVPYRTKRVCGMGPPSSGAHTVGQTLMLLEGFDLGAKDNLAAVHLITEAEALAFSDRNRYLADADFVPVPAGLLNPSYINSRRKIIDPKRAIGLAFPGVPVAVKGDARGIDGTFERSGTTHISIVDGDGNAVSMTSSIEGAFGSGLWAAGFLLNNELTDFSFRPNDTSGRAIANRVEGGKRPRSSMAPTIILNNDGSFFAALGSPGGSRIIPYVVKSVVALIDWGMDAQATADLVNFGNRNRGVEIEAGERGVQWQGKLKQFGHEAKLDTMTSGLHIIVSRGGRLEGGADPRRDGIALGD